MVDPKEVKNPVDELLGSIAIASNKWLEAQREGVEADVYARLNKARDEVVMKLLGFDRDSWNGSWRIDHCNSRSGNSIAGDLLMRQQHEKIKEWMSRIKLPSMTPAFKKKVEKELQDRYEQQLMSGIYDVVKRKVNQDLQAVLEETMTSKEVDRFLKLRSLIGADPDRPAPN